MSSPFNAGKERLWHGQIQQLTPKQLQWVGPDPSLDLSPGQGKLIGRVLSPALQLWLRSLVEAVEELAVKIQGGDRQILSGHIPQVSIRALGAVYQGLHLGQIYLTGTGIRINIGQLLKGKPLRLLEQVAIAACVQLSEADLNASLPAPLFANALTEFLLPLLSLAFAAIPKGNAGVANRYSSGGRSEIGGRPWMGYRGGEPLPDDVLGDRSLTLQNLQITLGSGQLTLSGQLVGSTCNTTREGTHPHTPVPFVLNTGLAIASNHELLFVNPSIQVAPSAPITALDSFQLDLGSQVAIEEINLSPGQIVCRGRIVVIP